MNVQRLPSYVLLLAGFVLFAAPAGIVAAPPEPPKEGAAGQPAEVFQAASPLEIEAPLYPARLRRDGSEGWVIVSFVIDESGVPSDISVEDSMGETLFEHAAVAAVEKWRYAPATLNGEAVAQPVSFYKISFRLDPPQVAASSGFARLYRKGVRAFKRNRLEEVDETLSQMESNGLGNFYEQVSYWMLKLQTAIARSSENDMLEAATAVWRSGPGYIPDDAFASAGRIRFRILAKRKRFQEAVEVYQQADEYGLPAESFSEIAPLVEQIEAYRQAEEMAYGVTGRISHGAWGIKLFTRSFYLDDIEGEIEDIEIFCKRHVQSTRRESISLDAVRRGVRYEAGVAWRIPEAWGSGCRALVHGKEGTRFTFVHQTG